MSADIFWPGSNVAKSQGNAFTMKFEGSGLGSSADRAKATVRAKAVAKAQESNRCESFGGNQLKNLSRRARAEIQDSKRHISIGKTDEAKSARMRKAGI